MFEAFLRDPSVADFWRSLGGLETLHSYGIPTNDLMLGKGFDEAARALKDATPKEHLQFFASLRHSVSIGEYFICHAGVRPTVPLAQQKIDDLLWIRDEFLHSELDFGKMVIHGHSPNEWPEIRRNRINIDTGAFATGRLTCLVIDDNRGRLLFTA